MAVFDVNTFRAKFEKYGGPGRLNLFTVELTATNSKWMDDSDLRFFCKSVGLPGLNLETSNYKPYGVGLTNSLPVTMAHGSVNAVFMLDSSHQVLAFFHEWMQSIFNYNTEGGLLAPNARDQEQLPYELGYKKDYALDMRIKFYSAHNPNNYYECILHGVYPTEIGQIDLSWDSNDQIALLPINFSFERIGMSGARSGSVQSDLSRSVGLLEYIVSIANIGQTIKSFRKPRDVQDAINQFTSLKTVFSRLGGLF